MSHAPKAKQLLITTNNDEQHPSSMLCISFFWYEDQRDQSGCLMNQLGNSSYEFILLMNSSIVKVVKLLSTKGEEFLNHLYLICIFSCF
jgi:hypothetical protein